MAERAVISVIQYLGPLLAGEVELLRGVRKEMVSIKAELERIHSFLKDAESRAETGDEASQIQDIKTTIREIKEGADRYGFSTSTSSEHSSSNTKDNMWRDPRLASLFIGDDEVVGIKSPKYELISRLVDQNQSQQAVISVVGIGGIGKTTLAKKVYDSQEVVAHFNCKAWIIVSQSYKPEELLKKMIEQLSGNDVLPLPDEGIESLIVKLRGYLSAKRYVIVFDDVWETDFWRSIRHALPKNSDGSQVIITILHFAKKLQWIMSTSLKPYPKRRLGNSFARKPSNWTLRVIVPLSWRKYHMQLLESVKVCHLQLQL
ncbi:hypothetical protein CsSME_00034442 [Camellia sinensis var. sinensis]